MSRNRLSDFSLKGNLRILNRALAGLAVLWLACSAAGAYGQERAQRFSVSIKDAYLSELFLQIEKQGGYSFVYTVSDIRALGKKDIVITNSDLRSILDRVLTNTGLSYEIRDTHVVISKAAQPPGGTVIAGRVTDSEGQPVAGATVRVKGSNTGAVTDAAGNYRLGIGRVDPASVTLTFSCIGLETREVRYPGSGPLNVTLRERVDLLDEVVVHTGYQTLSQSKNPGAVTSLDADDLVVPGLNTIDQMLEGHVPGLIFIQNSGSVGAAPRLRIRGTSTILGNQEPLWVVDGIIQTDPVNVDPNLINDLDFVNLLGNAISGLNPDDIEQIDILKDASATAIYGTRAGNGVIVVTTKKGKPGPPQVGYAFSGTFAVRPHYSDRSVNMMTSRERIEYSREMIEKRQLYTMINSWVGYEGAVRDLWNRKIGFDEFQRQVGYYESMNTDWFDILTRNAFTQKHTVSVSGGSQEVRYYASVGLNDAQGNVKNEYNKTYTANLNISANVDRFSMRFGVQASVQERKYNPSELDVLSYAYNTNRAIPAYDDDGGLYYYYKNYIPEQAPGARLQAPFNILNEMENSFSTSKIYSSTITAQFGYRIADPLKLDVTLSYTMGSADQQTYYDEKTYRAARLRAPDDIPGNLLAGSATTEELDIMPYGGELNQAKTDRGSYTLRGQLNYDKSFGPTGKHAVNAALGGEISSTEYNKLQQAYRGFEQNRNLHHNEFSIQDYPAYYTWYQKEALAKGVHSIELTNLVSAYATATYEYDSRYIFNVNARIDMSNQFGSRAREKVLPVWSFAARWNIRKDFFPDSRTVNALSLRASEGIQGNMISTVSSRLVISRLGERNAFGEPISKVYSYPNPDLKWEKTYSTNVMLDFALFGNAVNGSVAFWWKHTRDAFLNMRVAQIEGVTGYDVNKGDVQNRGMELGLMFNVIDRTTRTDPYGFRWSLSPNFGQTLNSLLTKANSQTLRDNYTYRDFLDGRVEIPGRALNPLYSYKFTGLSGQDGRPTFYGMDEEQFRSVYEGYSDKADVFMTVMDYSGRRVPVFQGGLMSNMSWKRFSLTFNLAYSLGSKVRMLRLYDNVYSGYGTIAPQPHMNVRKEFLGRWRNPGDENHTTIPGTLSGSAFTETVLLSNNWWMNKSYTFADNIWQMYDYSDERVASGNYLKLQSLSLRYNLPERVCRSIYLKSASVGLSGTNLFVLCDPKLKGQDPTTQSGSATTLNMSNRSNFSFSLNINF